MYYIKKIMILFSLSFVLFIGCEKKDDQDNSTNYSYMRNENEAMPLLDAEYDYSDFNLNQPDYYEDSSEQASFTPGDPLSIDEDLSAITVNYYDPNQLNVEPLKAVDDKKPLTVVDCGPKGELPNEMTKKPTIYVVFSKAMVPLSKLGDPMTSFKGIEFTPPMTGVYRWYGSKMLSFEPDGKVMPLKRYNVTVKEGIKSIAGKKLKKDFSFTFFTETLKMTACYPYSKDGHHINGKDIPIKDAGQFMIQFSYPVDIDYIKQFINFSCRGKKVPFDLIRPLSEKEGSNLYSRSALIKFKEFFPENSSLSVKLLKGASPDSESIKTTSNQIKNFHTIKPFKYKRHGNHNYTNQGSSDKDSNPLYLYFSHPVDKETVMSNVTVSLKVDNLADVLQVYGSTVQFSNLPVLYGSKYSVTLKPGIKDIYGRKLGVEKTISVFVGRANSYAYFKENGYGILESGFPAQVAYEYQNVYGAWSSMNKVEDPLHYKVPELSKVDFFQTENTRHFRMDNFEEFLNKGKKGAVFVGRKFKYIPSYRLDKENIEENDYRFEKSRQLLQVTDLGVTARYGYNGAVVWVKSMSKDSAVSNATVELISGNGSNSGYNSKILYSGKTNSEGLLRINFEDQQYPFSQYNRMQIRSENFLGLNKAYFRMEGLVIRVTKDDDTVAFVPSDGHNRWRFNLYNTTQPKSATTIHTYNLCFTDRGLYKPGETLSFRGIAQQRSVGDYSPVHGAISISSARSAYNSDEIYSQNLTLSRSGGYHSSFIIPETAKPGDYRLTVLVRGKSFTTFYQVAEFKRAEFQVSIEKPDGHYYAGDKISLSGEGEYLSGGMMKGAECSSFWVTENSRFSPKRKKYESFRYGPNQYISRKTVGQSSGTLDNKGQIDLEQQTENPSIPGKPINYHAELSVRDKSRQELAAKSSVTVHPASFYLGAKIDSDSSSGWWSTYVAKGDKIDFQYVTVTPEEEAYQRSVEVNVTMIKHEWKQTNQQGVYGNVNYRWSQVDKTVETRTIKIAKSSSGKYSFTPKEAGSYKLIISAEDEKGRLAVTHLDYYVTGGSWGGWISDNPDQIELIPEKDKYSPGETARIFMKSPLPKGDYLITVEREGLLDEKLIHINQQTEMIEIPVKEEYLPVFYVAVCSASGRTAPPPTNGFDPDLGKPNTFFGMTSVLVDTESKELKVEIIPSSKTYKPGSQGMAKVYVSKDGKPVAHAEVTFLAVDRGVLDLIDYHVPEPVSYFYSPEKFPHGVAGGDSRRYLIDPVTYDIKDLKGGGGKKQIREDFNPLAVFEPMLITDKDGYALVKFKFPDTLTTYRSTAFVVDGNEFGYREQELFVRNPVTVRTAKPLALRLRDTSVISVILTNLTDKEWKINLQVSSNLLKIEGKSQVTVKLPAEETIEVPFMFLAVKEGEASIEVEVSSPVLNEILKETIEVRKPHIKESFTITGNAGDMSGGKVAKSVEAFMIPKAVDPGYGGVTIKLTNNPFCAIEKSVQYLDEYGYYPLGYMDYYYRSYPHMLLGENISSLAPNLKLDKRDINEFKELVNDYQYKDGGINPYGFFFRNRAKKSNSHLSIMTAEYVQLAANRGIKILSESNKSRLHKYLISLDSDKDFSYSRRPKLLYVRSLYGENIKSQADKVLEHEDSLGIEGLLYLGLAYSNAGHKADAKAILQRIKNFIKVGTRSVDLISTYETRSYWPAPETGLSLLCRLYYQLNDIDDMFIRYTNTIHQSIKHGYWGSRGDSLQYLLAAADVYAKEKTMNDLVAAKVILNETILMERELGKGRESDVTQKFQIFSQPIVSMPKNQPLPFLFQSESGGRLFYSANFEYCLPAEVIRARDEGLGVYREIQDLEGNIIKGNELKLNKTYRMKVVISSSKTRYDVGMRVPFPSGCDAINSSFVTSGTYAPKGGTDNRTWDREMYYGDEGSFIDEGYWDYYGLYSIQPEKVIYKNEVSYRFGMLYAGQQTVDFLFRATTPGVYPTPPAQAEALEESEVFGRSEGRIFTIK